MARWQAPAGDAVTAVAISPDSRALVAAAGETLRIWRIDAVPEVRLTEYTADTPEGPDLLGTQPTVDALAAILVARAVEPPLSLGLFGAWGSGKTFFMRRLERRVDMLSRESHDSGRAQASLWAWRNLRQVRFNAWHYASADVWAGMLEQLIRELAQPARLGALELSLPPELSQLEMRRIRDLAGARERDAETVEKLNEAGRDLQQKEEEAQNQRKALDEAKKKAQETRTKGPRELLTGQAVSSLDTALAAAGISTKTDSLDRTLRDIEATRRALWSNARGRDRRWLSWALIVIMVTGLGVTALLQLLGVDLAGTIGMLSALFATVAAGFRWLGSAATHVDTKLAALDQAERETRAAETEMAASVRHAEDAVQLAASRVAPAEQDRDVARQELDLARERAAQATPGNLLAEYLEGRHTTGDYRSLLGLIGTVRRDLEIISDAVERNNHAASEDPARPPDDVVNRIILYVDDLDRCPPAVVVKVLEAVAMLLTFPLFVVVVAVDAHWITKSLAAVYPDLLKGGDVTPDNYLEKIFQMPVWLDRPTDDAAAIMARSLLAPEREALNRPKSGADLASRESRSTAPETPANRPEAVERVRADVSIATTPPAAVTLEDSEVSAIEALAPMVARTPRALKRYLNTYRVLKALVPVDDLDSVRLLLAVATGNPDLGERLLTDIIASPNGHTLESLVNTWPEQDRRWLHDSLDTTQQRWRDLDCRELRPVAHDVRRFVFHAAARPTGPDADPALRPSN